MDLDPIIARLKDQLDGFKAVGGAADLDAVLRGVVPAPSAFVIPLSEAAAPNRLQGAFEQAVTVEFGVLLVIANRRDTSGAAAISGLKPYRDQVAGALLAWVPVPANGEPVEFSGGRLLRFDDGLLWWTDEFRVKTYRGRA